MQAGNGWGKHDAWLAFRSNQADQSAFDDVYRNYASRVRGLLAHLNGHGSALDDLTQQVFTEYWKHRGRCRTDDSIKAYLFGIAVNVLREHRRRSRKAPLELADMSWVSDRSRSDDMAASEERAEQLARALLQAKARLSDKQLQAIELFHILHLPVRRAAKIARCSPQAFEARLRRAQRRLRQLLQPRIRPPGSRLS